MKSIFLVIVFSLYLIKSYKFIVNINVPYIFVWRKFFIPAKLVPVRTGSGNPAGAAREPPLHPACAGPVSRSERDGYRAGIMEIIVRLGPRKMGNFYSRTVPERVARILRALFFATTG